jgi:hypothetical protein
VTQCRLWRPNNDENPRGDNRLFADGEEQQLAYQIRQQYIQQRLLFTDQDFKLFAIAADYEFRPINASAATLRASDFTAKRGFMSDFSKRNRFSSLRAHLKQRPAPDPEARRAWKTKIADLLIRQFFSGER